MQTWSITLHGPAGIISTVDAGESQFVVGIAIASDVFTVIGDGVSERHAWVWISEASLQEKDLGGWNPRKWIPDHFSAPCDDTSGHIAEMERKAISCYHLNLRHRVLKPLGRVAKAILNHQEPQNSVRLTPSAPTPPPFSSSLQRFLAHASFLPRKFAFRKTHL
jgi:hypothetical protein